MESLGTDSRLWNSMTLESSLHSAGSQAMCGSQFSIAGYAIKSLLHWPELSTVLRIIFAHQSEWNRTNDVAVLEVILFFISVKGAVYDFEEQL